MRRAVLILALCLPGPVLGAAWPREAGTGFASLTHDRPGDGGSYTSLFAEWGTPRLTFGAKLGRAGDGAGEARVFARRPFPVAQPWAASWEIGVGLTRDAGGDSRPALRPAAAFGRGLDTRWGNGWLELETALNLDTGGYDSLTADLTLGLNRPGGDLAILQFRGRHDEGGAGLTLAPSYVHRLPGDLSLQAGALWAPGDAPGLSLSLWTEF